ncbi:MAG TPA: MarR family transcriptional regulator [Steroidobacteraceae bacterium]|nr:MarR family transcriptional regulator [Steroidobacteraceae bacterium]
MFDLTEPLLLAHGFSQVQYGILAFLRDNIAVNPKDICREYRYDGGALTRVFDELRERGLLERDRCGRDRRKVNLRLTAAGRQAIEAVIPDFVTALNRNLSDFSTAEVHEFTRLLSKFNSNLQSNLDAIRVPARQPRGPPHGRHVAPGGS